MQIWKDISAGLTDTSIPQHLGREPLTYAAFTTNLSNKCLFLHVNIPYSIKILDLLLYLTSYNSAFLCQWEGLESKSWAKPRISEVQFV